MGCKCNCAAFGYLICTALLATLLMGCHHDLSWPRPDLDSGPDGSGCSPEKIICVGRSSDKSLVCVCGWYCPPHEDTCYHKAIHPPGDGWMCAWLAKNDYTCHRKGEKGKPPDKTYEWECDWLDWMAPSAPGEWKCTVDNDEEQVSCKRVHKKTTPTGGGQWDCIKSNGPKVCTKKDNNGGLPQGGSDWKCGKTLINGTPYWICHGTTDAGDKPPNGTNWKCQKVKSGGQKDTWKCERTEAEDDFPPGGSWWACAMGSLYKGIVCTEVPEEPTPTPKVDGTCVPGSKLWCSGSQYSGWGQVTCLSSGKWETTIVSGNPVINCQELTDGRRPDTWCACYHFFYNPTCCERPDCILPKNSSGQKCPAGQGKLCDHCDPLNPQCKEPGAHCITTMSHESFCGKSCSTAVACPTGYKCASVQMTKGTTMQCVPGDYSCFY